MKIDWGAVDIRMVINYPEEGLKREGRGMQARVCEFSQRKEPTEGQGKLPSTVMGTQPG